MSRTSGYRLSVMIFAMAVCLTMPACQTSKEKACDANEVSASSDTVRDTIAKLKETIIPEMTFYYPATIVDAVEFFKKASREYAKPGTPPEQRGVSFELSLLSVPQQGNRENADPFAVSTNCVTPRIAAISTRAISLFDAIQLVCEATDMKWRIQQNGTVNIFPRGSAMDEDAITRTYTVPQTLADSILNTPNDQPSEADTDKSCFMTTDQPSDVAADKAWKALFKQLGVTEPKWTQFNYLPVIGKLRVTSTKENLAIIESIFDRFSLHMIEVEMQIHAFRTADIERLRLSGGMSLEELMALRQKGKSRLVASATALTKSGQEAIVKAVKEVRYPTELLTDFIQATSNGTSRSATQVLMPDNFTIRETGMILQVVPEVSADNSLVNMTLKPQWITLDCWESYRAGQAASWTLNTPSLTLPVFGVTSFETVVTVKNGETLLIGSCSTPDGDWVNVGLLTARLKDVEPYSSACHREKTKSQSEHKDAEVVKKMREMVIPEITLRPPCTIIDAIRYFKQASIQYDKTGISEAQRGVNFVLKVPMNFCDWKASSTLDPFPASAPVTNSVPVIPAMSPLINLYDVLKHVCDITCMQFRIRDGVVWIVPYINTDEQLLTRRYFLRKDLCERINDDSNNLNHDCKNFFEQFGVPWPAGSSINFLASIGMLRVTNTPENLDVLEQVMEPMDGDGPRMAEADVQIHAFRAEDIDKLRLSDDMSVEALMALRKTRKSRQVASATIVTKSGTEAIVKSVREVPYPTELLTDGIREGSAVVTPGNFTMREVGMTLQVVPEINYSSHVLINTTIKPQWITLDGWETYPAGLGAGWTHKALSFKQPVFGMTSFETQTVVEAGKTVLLGSSSTPDGKWVHVGFLTVKESR